MTVASRLLRHALVPGLLAVTLGGCMGVGGPRPGAPAHHRERGFANTNPAYARPPFWTRMQFFVTRMLETTFAPKTATFPVAGNDGRALRANAGDPTVTWVGHATLLVQLDGVNVLIDPHWSPRASPFGFAGPKRVTTPALAFEDLPPVHVVVISHDHYDHLDVASVRRLAAEHRPRFLVPLGMKAWFADLGIAGVEELDWWDARTVRGLTFTAVPAQHFAQRTLWDMNRRLWAGWTVAGRDRRLFFAGDTAYFEGFKAIAARWGPFDLADEPLTEPPRLLAQHARERGLGPDRVWILKHGETRQW